ncbi:unnamed protein product [Lampetra planeri]
MESALAYRSALLALARAKYPRMDQEGIDSLVLQKLLRLGRELRVVLPAPDDDDFSSLRAARSIHVHLLLQRDATIAACAIDTGDSEEDQHSARAFASASTGGWRSSSSQPCEDMRRPERGTPPSDGSSVCS